MFGFENLMYLFLLDTALRIRLYPWANGLSKKIEIWKINYKIIKENKYGKNHNEKDCYMTMRWQKDCYLCY